MSFVPRYVTECLSPSTGEDDIQVLPVQGMQTVVATNETLSSKQLRRRLHRHNEHWEHYPDDVPLRTLALKGDSRAALAPFLAYR